MGTYSAHNNNNILISCNQSATFTHDQETSQIRVPQTFESTAILVIVDHPRYLHQYWGKVTALFATTKSIEAFRCRRPLVFRNWNDSECDKNPLELNSPGPIHTVRRHQEHNYVTSISQRFRKYPHDPKKIWVRRVVESKHLRHNSSPERRRG
jgi:hypothetical protein